MITTSIRTSMGGAADFGFRPLEPPENWEHDNREQLHIISPMSSAYTEEINGFRIISPTSDISNPSDVWRTMHHQPPVVVVHHDRNTNGQHYYNHHYPNKENLGSESRRTSKTEKKSHHRIDSLTRVFGCFDEDIRMNTIKKQEEEERQSRRHHLVEI